MSADVSKKLDRAKRFLEKNRVEDAIEAYLAVLDDAPQHQEATQALGDLYARMHQPDRAAVYYGTLFDLLIDPRDETKAVAIFNRFLRSGEVAQPPERITRYAFLQQKQNRGDEALEQYTKAAELFTAAGREDDALFCWERIAQLDPDNFARQLRLGEAAERLHKPVLAARAFLRAGQLAESSNAREDALKLLERAQKLAPQERGVALLYAQALLRAGRASQAAALLEPFSASETDTVFLNTFGSALMGAGQLDRAREVLDRLLREKNEGMTGLFELAHAYAAAGRDGVSVEILKTLKNRMFAAKRHNDFAVQTDALAEKHLDSQLILEFWAALYNELNRESKYFEILAKLFDLSLNSGNISKASEIFETLVDIDAYDYRNQDRLERLRGRVDDSFLQRVASHLAKSGSIGAPSAAHPHPGSRDPDAPAPSTLTEEARQAQVLEDLIVQTEIFLQYSLQTKAIDRLQKIASMFPGEEDHNPRLASLYLLANWRPPLTPKSKSSPRIFAAVPAVSAAPVEAPPELPAPASTKTGVYTAETLRDLSKIAEINQLIFRQQTPRAMLSTAVNEVGAYLKVTRALAMIGAPGRPPEMAAEFCASSVKPVPGAQVVLLLAHMEKISPDELGGLMVTATPNSILKELGLSSALGVVITDKETQMPAGMLIVGRAEEQRWKPNETYLLQAIGDQMLLSVSHTRLRSLVRRMGVSDERSGLLSRSSYQSCLLAEADRARSQGTPLTLTILQIDRGPEILRQQGEPAMDRFLEQLSRALQAIVRQNDVAIKYSSWSLAFILPDTPLAGGQFLADKLRRAASGLRPPWDATQITLSATVVEAVTQPDYDSEDIVTDLINRAEVSVEEARKRGGEAVAAREDY
ncbi:MAG: hypothetical protein NVS9B4_07480 [Candidatus Acidiferrum sp.]